MPIIPQQQTIVQYTANQAQLNYTFAFYAPLPTDIQVYYQASNATPVPSNDLLVLNVDYTVTYNSNPITGGFITLLFTPTTGYYLTINRQVAASLSTNFSNAQNFNGENLDAALDRLLLLCQQNLNYILERNLSYVINSYLPDAAPFTQLPPLPQNYVWVGSGSGVVAAPLSSVPSASVLQAMLANSSPGTDGARIVGYYDIVDSVSTTVQAFLANIVPFIQTQIQNQLWQPGDIKEFGGTVIPSGWLLCDGTAISRTTFANLFAAIGTNFGVGDGTTTFNIPDFRRRVAMGSGGSGTGVIGSSVGNFGGEEAHTMLLTELVSHTHAPVAPQTNFAGGFPPGTGTFNFAAGTNNGSHTTTAATGGGTPFNIIQPSLVVTKIIKT